MSSIIENWVLCFYHCIENSEILSLIIIIFLIIISSIIIYLITKKSAFMLLSQLFGSTIIILNFLMMNCKMFILLFFYLAFFIGSVIFLIFIRHSVEQRLKTQVLKEFDLLTHLEKEFGIKIFLLDTQKRRAFSHKKKIYISVGMLEILNENEVKAVIAHEAYHVRKSPNRLLATALALTSLWFIMHNDEVKADRFAAKTAGKEHLESALKKLTPKKWKKRVRKINC